MRVASLIGFLILVPLAANARRVVLLDFTGDQGGRVREQLQTSLLQAGRMKVVPREELEEAVSAHNGYLGWNIKLEDARPVARKLGAGTIVTGTVSDTLDLKLFDANGEPLWSKRLPLLERRLTEEQLQRLTAAMGVAVRIGRRSLAPPPTDSDSAVESALPGRSGARSGSDSSGARWSEREVADLARRAVLMRGAAEPVEAAPSRAKANDEDLELAKLESEREATLAEIQSARQAARKRREEARALEEQARMIGRIEAERVAAAKKAARLERKLQEATEKHRAELAVHEAELARAREASALQQAEALRRREEVTRRMKELTAKANEGSGQQQVAEAPPVAAGRH